MFKEKRASLHRYIGRYLLHWVLIHAGMWFLKYRCVDLVAKFHGPLDRSIGILDQLLQLEGEDDEDLRRSDNGAENNENDPLDFPLRTSYRCRRVQRPG
jgi:hypothetical protein